MAGDTNAVVITTSNPRVNIHHWNLIGFLVTDLVGTMVLVSVMVGLDTSTLLAEGGACFRTRLTAQCIPCLARWLFGLIDNAFSRYAILARGEDTAASHNQASSICGFMFIATRAQCLVLA